MPAVCFALVGGIGSVLMNLARWPDGESAKNCHLFINVKLKGIATIAWHNCLCIFAKKPLASVACVYLSQTVIAIC